MAGDSASTWILLDVVLRRFTVLSISVAFRLPFFLLLDVFFAAFLVVIAAAAAAPAARGGGFSGSLVDALGIVWRRRTSKSFKNS